MGEKVRSRIDVEDQCMRELRNRIDEAPLPSVLNGSCAAEGQSLEEAVARVNHCAERMDLLESSLNDEVSKLTTQIDEINERFRALQDSYTPDIECLLTALSRVAPKMSHTDAVVADLA